MSEHPIGLSWYRDGYLFEPMADGRVRISIQSQPVRDLTMDASSWEQIKEAIDNPKRPWSTRGRWAS